jgi:Beta-glucosidase-related glycosidases
MTSIGPIMADIAGPELSAEEREYLRHPQVGGVILFARNYVDREQLRALTTELLALRTPRLLLAVDYEGGRVQRFRVGFSRVPAMRTLGKLCDESPMRAQEQAREHGATIARELGEFGFDLCFAPVLDRDIGISQVIGDRAFDSDPQRIILLARAFREGLNRGGMAATAKHFPGHGAVAPDSHQDLPVDRRPFAEIELRDLPPFRALAEDGVESIMTAHVRFSAVDDLPASFSRRWVRGVLRNQWKYNGAVFADDLTMGAAAAVGDLVTRANLALEAGCDMLPVCNDRTALVALLDALPAKARRLSSARLRRLYRREPSA